MKFIQQTITFFCVLLTLICSAQDPERKHSIGLYQNFTDYNVSLLDNKLVAFDSSLSHSTRFAYQRRLSRTWMLNAGIANGFILNQNIKKEFVTKAYALGLDVSVLFKLNNGRIIKENPLIAPYFTFGYRTDYIPKLNDFGESPWLFHNQYGAGFNIRLSNRTHFQLQAALDQKLLGDFNTHIQYRMGITQSLGRLEDKAPKTKPKFDSDGDGIADALDKCPAQFGLQSMHGCPDTTSQYAAKIEKDSLAYLLKTKSAEYELMELELARLRNSTKTNDSISATENNLLNEMAALKQAKDSEIELLKLELQNQKKTTELRIDTVYIVEIVEKQVDNEDEKLRLAQEKKALQDKLDKERLLREKMLAEAKEKERLTLLQEQERLARLAKEEKERLALLEKQRNDSIAKSKKVVIEYPPIPEDKNYYVITISSPNKSTADNWLQKMLKDFEDARIIPQPNGYYRVGVYVGKDRAVGLEILEKVKQIGYDPAWLSVE